MTTTAAPKDKPKYVECRFAVYAKSKQTEDDIHLVKEQITHADGTQTPHLRILKNYERPFHITNKGNRNHKDFKEWEEKSKLNEYKATQTKMAQAIANALGQPYFRGSLRDLCKSPFIYGADILSTSIIKQSYKKLWDVQTPLSNAVFDTETDVIHGTGQIVMATISFKERVLTVVQKSFVAGHSDAVNRIKALANKYIGEIITKRNIELDVRVVDTEIDVIKTLMKTAHQWSPDILSVWNLEFDMDKVIDACARANVNIADLLSDPSVPEEYRFFKFKKGLAKKVTASGRVMNFKPSQRWHTVFCPSGFYWMDAMSLYRQVRQGAPEETAYSLDHILKINGLAGKLKFKEADHLEKLAWHKFMQSSYPLEYVVYNIYDCVGMELLDEKTHDIRLSLPMFAGCTDFQNFNSLPRKTMNDLHYFVEGHDKVPGSTASEMSSDMDADTTDVSGWVVMLPSHLVADNGLKIVKENPLASTTVRIAVADLDISGAYPSNELVCNVSKQTTSKELIEIKGIDEITQRMQTINFSGGHTNAVEFCTKMYGMPTLDTLLDAFNAQ